MRLILIGCEYAGKTTLAVEISAWMRRVPGISLVRWHNHFVVPRLDQHLMVGRDEDAEVPGKPLEEEWGAEEFDQILAMSPALLEQFQRHMIWRHLCPDMFRDPDYLLIDWYYADAVYAPLYYGYGEPGSFADRRQRARAWDAEVMRQAPDTVLVLVRAAADLIRQRQRRQPHPRGLLAEPDVELVLDRFQEEFDSSLIARRFVLDTTRASIAETLQEFLSQIPPHLSPTDQQRAAAPAAP